MSHQPHKAMTPPDSESGFAESSSRLATQRRHDESFAQAIERIERLETTVRIARRIAHDFNNLLAPLVAYPTLMLEQLQDDHPALPLVHEMELAARRLVELSRQLLTLGRREESAVTDVDLNRVVEETVAALSPFPSELQVMLDLSSGPAQLKGVEVQLTSVIRNLLRNARAVVEDHGRITVRTRRVSLDGKEGKLETIPAGSYFRLEVIDNGSPLDVTDLEYSAQGIMMDPRLASDPEARIGLALVQAVVRDHLGYVDVESLQGHETRYCVYFPAPAPAFEPRSPTDSPVAPRRHGAGLLLISDDPICRQELGACLKNKGFRLTVAFSGEQALALLGVIELPEMILVDLDSGHGMSAGQVIAGIQEVASQVPVVVASDPADVEHGSVSERMAAIRSLPRPIQPGQLSLLLEELRISADT